MRNYSEDETAPFTKDTGVLARMDAIRILFRWLDHGEFPDRSLGKVPGEYRAFVMDLTYTTVRWARAIDWVLGELLSHPAPRDAEAALMLGVCQLLKMDEIPPYAAIHATVEALKQIAGRRTPVGLVNGVLRTVDREREAIQRELARQPAGVRLSHPDDLIAAWTERYGAERAEAMCAWDNEPALVSVLTVPGGPDVGELRDRFAAAGVNAAPHPGFPEAALLLPHGGGVERLPGFAEGLFAVQDPATLGATDLVGAAPGMRVLDACSAPGGKTARMARAMNGEGELVALELHADRVPALEQTLDRLVPDRASFVKVRVANASGASAEELGGAFDRILLDVPCSNTGVLRRRVDARWRLDAGRLARVYDAQGYLLDHAPELLKGHGRLVYSTCSIDPRENEERVAWFLARHPEFRLVEERKNVPPDRGADGAYAAALER